MAVISVDFDTMMQDEDDRVRIHESEVQPAFVDGLPITIGDVTLQVNAVIELDTDRNVWWARLDWSTRRDLDADSNTTS